MVDDLVSNYKFLLRISSNALKLGMKEVTRINGVSGRVSLSAGDNNWLLDLIMLFTRHLLRR